MVVISRLPESDGGALATARRVAGANTVMITPNLTSALDANLRAAAPQPPLKPGDCVLLTAALDGKLHTATVVALAIPQRKARAWGIEERDLAGWVLLQTCHGSLQPGRVAGLTVIAPP